MKAKIIFLGLITLYCSCQEAIRKGRPFPEVNTDSVTVIPTDEEHAEVIKVSDNVKSKVLSSELIEDFYYIETVKTYLMQDPHYLHIAITWSFMRIRFICLIGWVRKNCLYSTNMASS